MNIGYHMIPEKTKKIVRKVIHRICSHSSTIETGSTKEANLKNNRNYLDYPQ